MTNAEKYLKDNVSVEELIEQMEDKMVNKYGRPFYKEDVKQFFEDEYQKIPPTLTEDERVILRNIEHPYKWIRRNCKGELQISDKEDCAGLKWFINFTCYQNLFLFIKERRRIFY